MAASVAAWLEETVRSQPDAPALTGDDRRWTYGELWHDVQRIAASFRRLGIEKGDSVAIYSGNHPAVILDYLAASRIGAVPCAINFLFKARELAYVVDKIQPKVMVTDDAHLGVAMDGLAKAEIATPVYVTDGEVPGSRRFEELHSGSGDPGPMPGPDDDFEILFTSGTTGHPKGAVFTNAAVLYQLGSWSDYFGLSRDETVYIMTPLFHTAGNRYGALATLVTGGHAVLPDGFHPQRFWQEIVREEVTTFLFVEAIGHILLELPESEHERHHRVRRTVGSGHRDFLKRIEQRYGFSIVQGYGMTEIGLVLATDPKGDREVEQRRRDWRPGWNYVGFPTGPRTEVRIVDEEGKEVPDGSVGEISVRTPGVMRGYLDTPEDSPPTDADGYLRTGDNGARGPDGAIYFIDRSKDMIRRSGENIASKEVEEILESHPRVKEAAVYPVPDRMRAQEVKALCVHAEGVHLEASELWAWCSERLAEFKVPRYIEFRDVIPRNPIGRALKAQLRRESIEGAGRTWDRSTGSLYESGAAD
jgi:acyl-CoA synthetase (AMP-forming)/AMP-acid ligase II